MWDAPISIIVNGINTVKPIKTVTPTFFGQYCNERKWNKEKNVNKQKWSISIDFNRGQDN